MKDLVVDRSVIFEALKRTKLWLEGDAFQTSYTPVSYTHLNQRIAELETKYHDALAVVKDLEGRMKTNNELRYHIAACLLYTSRCV